MERKEDTVRVWVGLDLLQAKLMEEVLRENGIECFSDRDHGVIPVGMVGEVGVWVPKKDERRARQLLEQTEAEMSEAGKEEFEESDDQS